MSSLSVAVSALLTVSTVVPYVEGAGGAGETGGVVSVLAGGWVVGGGDPEVAGGVVVVGGVSVVLGGWVVWGGGVPAAAGGVLVAGGVDPGGNGREPGSDPGPDAG